MGNTESLVLQLDEVNNHIPASPNTGFFSIVILLDGRSGRGIRLDKSFDGLVQIRISNHSSVAFICEALNCFEF